MVALNQAMGTLSGASLKAALDPLIDVDQWMRTFAMLSLNGTDDVYGRIWEHNFRYYVRPTDQKIIALQWDLDRAFRLGANVSVTPTVNNQGDPVAVAKLFEIPQYRRLFDGHLQDLIETTFNSSYTTPWASHLTSVTGDNLNGNVSYVTGRANAVRGTLPGPVTFAITTNSGIDFSVSESVVTLEGKAWVDVFSIQVNGITIPITWTDEETWEMSVPVQTGSNLLTIAALNNRGTEVASDAITVTNTGTTALAHAGNTKISELHYHPADPSSAEITAGFSNADDFEFVEITNFDLTTEIDLTNVNFTDGVIFTFPDGTILAPGERVLVVSNQDAFEFRYGAGMGMIAGSYSGNLRNSGERVRLESADALSIADFTYGDKIPWPVNADGDGYSLVLAGTDPGNPSEWRTSVGIGGNPGGSDFIPFKGGDLTAYALAAEPHGETFSDSFLLNLRVNLGTDEAVVRARFSTDLVNWVTSTENNLVSRTNHGDGTATLLFQSPLPLSATTRQFGASLIEAR